MKMKSVAPWLVALACYPASAWAAPSLTDMAVVVLDDADDEADAGIAGYMLTWDGITLYTDAMVLCGKTFALAAPVRMQADAIPSDCDASDGDIGQFGSDGFDPSIPLLQLVPEPVSMALFGVGLFGLKLGRRARHWVDPR